MVNFKANNAAAVDPPVPFRLQANGLLAAGHCAASLDQFAHAMQTWHKAVGAGVLLLVGVAVGVCACLIHSLDRASADAKQPLGSFVSKPPAGLPRGAESYRQKVGHWPLLLEIWWKLASCLSGRRSIYALQRRVCRQWFGRATRVLPS